MESKFSNDIERSEFNIWLNQVYITGYGRIKTRKFIIIRTFNNAMSRKTLFTHKKHFNIWINEKIQEYKQLNLLK